VNYDDNLDALRAHDEAVLAQAKAQIEAAKALVEKRTLQAESLEGIKEKIEEGVATVKDKFGVALDKLGGGGAGESSNSATEV
jgi:hypothetical protein